MFRQQTKSKPSRVKYKSVGSLYVEDIVSLGQCSYTMFRESVDVIDESHHDLSGWLVKEIKDFELLNTEDETHGWNLPPKS